MRKWGKCISLLGMLFVLSLSGCAKQPEQVSGIEDTVVKTEVDWEQGFTVGSIQQRKPQHVIDYQEIRYELPETGDFVQGAILRNNGTEFIGMAEYTDENGREFYLEKISPDGKIFELIDIDSTDWEIEQESIAYFDIVGEKMYFVTDDTEGLSETVYVITTDLEGKLQKKVDILPGLRELEISGSLGGVYLDKDGFVYVMAMDENNVWGIYCVNSEGEAVGAYRCEEAQKDQIFSPIKDNRDQLFFPVYLAKENATKLLWKNSKDEWATLAELEYQTVSNWYAMRDNVIYYADSSSLIRWDVLSGERQKVLDLEENGISEKWNLIMLLTEDNAYLRYLSGEKDWVVKLTGEEPQYSDCIEVAVLTNGTGAKFLKSALADFSRMYTCDVKVEAYKEEEDISRVLIDVANGKGPDILYLSHDDMMHLKNKGGISQLETIISDKVKDSLLPGAVAFGEIEGKLYGIPTSVQLITMFTNRELWKQPGWSLDDVMTLAQNTQDLDSCFTIVNCNGDLGIYLMSLIGYDLVQEKSKFIDWKNGISKFETNDFMEVLEFIKYWMENQEEYQEGSLSCARDRIATAEVLAYGTEFCYPLHYDYLMGEYGDVCYAVGVPAEDKNGNYLYAEGVLVVNAGVETTDMAAIESLFEYLLSYDCQQKIYNEISVLDGIIDSRIKYDESVESYYWSDGTSLARGLASKEDGTTYIEEYKQLLKTAVPYKGTSFIWDIVWEEVLPYFEGQFTALDVTRKIDNRVQLYLDENY